MNVRVSGTQIDAKKPENIKNDVNCQFLNLFFISLQVKVKRYATVNDFTHFVGANVTTELKGLNLVHVVWIIYAEDGCIAALAKIPVQELKNSNISKILAIVSILN